MQNNKHRCLTIRSLNVLKLVAREGYLELLNGVKQDQNHPNRRIYIFDYDENLEYFMRQLQFLETK